jgi:hypothetical protein
MCTCDQCTVNKIQQEIAELKKKMAERLDNDPVLKAYLKAIK